MKSSFVLFLALILISNTLLAKGKKETMPSYIVQKDTSDTSIPQSRYVLEGRVVDISTGEYLKDVNLMVPDERTFTTDKNGNFQVDLATGLKYIGFRKPGYQTSYFENYEIKAQHRIAILVYMNKQDLDPQIMVEKPVVYAYSPVDLNLSILLKAKGELKFVYPAFSEATSWNMTLKNKQFVDQKGISYPYLFWDAEQKSPDYLVASGVNENYALFGEIVSRENIVTYLDSILDHLALNASEKTDFITYWGPRLSQEKYAFIQFQFQNECEQFASYEITPKPDHFNRLFLLFDTFDELPENFTTQRRNLSPFLRTGFNVLEWGGSQVELTSWIKNL